MQCPKCQFDNPADMQFCGRCGHKLANICPKCQSVNPTDFQFCGKCGTKLTQEAMPKVEVPKLEDMHSQLQRFIPSALAQRLSTAQKQLEGENRLVTALFADISGFTPMSQSLTTEAVVEKVNQCFKAIIDTVYRYEGSINRFIGDCALAFFGAPLSHENDPERAILAALDMCQEVSKLGLNISIGLNTGMMYFGPIGTQEHLEISAYGPDINLAKRLQEAAKPGQTLVGSGAYRLTRKAFDFNRLDSLTLKGIESPISAYEVLRIKDRPEKLRGIEGLRAQMIGRDREFADLKEAADQWLQGQGQIVSIIGEAGIGKSRLVSELKTYLQGRRAELRTDAEMRRWGDEERKTESPESVESFSPHLLISSSPHRSLWLEGRCVSIGQPISYWPFLDILKSYFNLSEADSEREVARKVAEAIQNLFPQSSDDILPFLGHLMSIRFNNELDTRLQFATPDQIKHQTLMRLKDLFATLAKERPLLLIFEDLHWSDDLSLDLISLLMDELITAPLMMLCVYRPEREHRVWQLSSLAQRKCLDRYTEINLKKLSSRESRQLVESLLTIDNLPERVKEMILQKSEGNPFFIEEVIRSLIDRDIIYREGERWKARAEVVEIEVPDTIQSVILTRVDRLKAEAKYVLQCASVIGRLFKYRLLEHLSQHERDLDRYIEEFEEKELVYEERSVPELEYAFRHALTQEATYQSILERSRKDFHNQVAVGIEGLYRERIEDYYEELAYHYSKSDNLEKAVEYLLKAGEKAKLSYANETAIAHFNRALEILEQGGIERKDWKLEALRGLGEVYFGMGKLVEAEPAFEKAIALAKEMGLPPRQLVMLYHWMGDLYFWQSRFDEKIRIGEMGLELLGDDTECMEAALINSNIAVANARKGNMEKFREYTHKNMAFIKKLPYSTELRPPYVHIVEVLVTPDRDFETSLEWANYYERLATQHHDLRGVADGWLKHGRVLEYKGDYKGGLSYFQKSLEIFERIGDNKHPIVCYESIGEVSLIFGNMEEAEKHIRLSLTLSEEVGFPSGIADAHWNLGTIAMCQHHWEDAISHYQKCLEGYQTIGNPISIALAYHHVGLAYLKKGDYQQALQSFEAAAEKVIEAQWVGQLANALCGLEETLARRRKAEGGGRKRETRKQKGGKQKTKSEDLTFVEFCRSFKERHAEAVKKLPLRQWYLESAVCSGDFSRFVVTNKFVTTNWIDEFGDCAYRIVGADGVRPNGLEICAANGRELGLRGGRRGRQEALNLSAPRLMREISKDFAVEVCVSPASEDKPRMGGLLMWKNKDNFLRLEIGVHAPAEVQLHGCISGKLQVIGRGLLLGNRGQETGNSIEKTLEKVHLRLERIGKEIAAYCSVDGKEWYTAGVVEFPVEDPIEIGLHAIGYIDRAIYNDTYPEGTATLFQSFKLWTQ